MEIGQIMPVARFNELAQQKWNKDYDNAVEEAKNGKRNWGNLPQLAFYLFFDKKGNPRKRGYVVKTAKNSYMCRSKKSECIAELRLQ
jgi:hypothetical protein